MGGVSELYYNEPAGAVESFLSILFQRLKQLNYSPPQDYPFHLASAVCEWIVSFSFIFFFFTYIDEFKVSQDPQNHATCLQRLKTLIL